MTTVFVFAGGGSLGAVEVGMLEALTAAGVRADAVVGASVGAINAVHFATDPSPAGVQRLGETWRHIRRRDVFPLSPWRSVLQLAAGRNYLIPATRLRQLLERRLPCSNLDETKLPCHVVVTDLLDGSEVRLASGPAVDILLATTAIPGVFPPVRLGERLCVDGGVASHTPIAAAVALGAERVVVLPTGTTCVHHRPPHGIIATALHALNIVITRQLAADVERFTPKATVAVVPPLCPLAVSSYDFSHADELIRQASEMTTRWLASGGLASAGGPGVLRPHVHGHGAPVPP